MSETDDQSIAEKPSEQSVRDQAIEQIKKKRDLVKNAIVFVLVNAGLWGIWALDGAKTDDLWPAIVNGIWAILLIIDVWKVYGERPISEAQIREELKRMGSG